MLLTLLACWSVGDNGQEFSTVPFISSYAATENGVVETITTSLECPDGQAARFYVVYASDWVEARTSVIVLHSSSFDYVVTPNPADPLGGQHWAGVSSYSRLERDWGIQKVWETLGMLDNVDPSESNLGTLPAALLDAGLVGIYPINCWGDLWHNESGLYPNDLAAEHIDRNGGAFAWWMVRFVTDAEFASSQQFYTGALVDPEQVVLIGLGDGARGATELVLREPEGLTGLLLDSPIDNLQQWQEEVPGVDVGLERIYFEPGGDDVDWLKWSLKRILNTSDTLDGVRIGLVHSSIDPQVPSDNLTGTLNALPADACLVDTELSTHVHTNSDLALAQDLVDFVALGNSNGRCGEDTGR